MEEPCLYLVNALHLRVPTVASPERLDVTIRRLAATVARKRNRRKLSSNLMCSEAKAMEKEIIFLVEEALEGGYEARALGHSIFTEADTFEELKGMVQDAVHCHFEETERPSLIRLHLVKDEIIAV
jgi:hypothetical protein